MEPWEEVCLAADQHDVGMAAWDLEPSFNPETGLPHSFMEMPLEVHTELWLDGPRRLVSQSAYAALLVSLHGWRLYRRRDLDRSPPDEAARIREFLAAQEEFQAQLTARLSGHPGVAAKVRERNSLLLLDLGLPVAGPVPGLGTGHGPGSSSARRAGRPRADAGSG